MAESKQAAHAMEGYKLTILASEGISAYAQPLPIGRLNLSNQLIHAVMGIQNHDLLIKKIGAHLNMQDHGRLLRPVMPTIAGISGLYKIVHARLCKKILFSA